MARFQDVRGRLEAVTRDALATGGIERVIFDNTIETPPALPYAIMTVSFGSTIARSRGCVADNLVGSLVVTIATGKQQGSSAGEDAAQAVLQAWGQLNCNFSDTVRLRTYNHDGPTTFSASNQRDERTATHLHTLNCGFTARVWGPPGSILKIQMEEEEEGFILLEA